MQRDGRQAPSAEGERCLAGVIRGSFALTAIDKSSVRVGRAADTDITLEDSRVSACHALIVTYGSGAVEIIDNHSLRGTYVNGDRIDRRYLAHGDVVRVGETSMVYLEPPLQAPWPA